MKIKISELEGPALKHAAYHAILSEDGADADYAAECVAIFSGKHLRHIVTTHTDGDTVEVPVELVEVKA